MKADIFSIADQLLAAAANGVYQGAVVALAVGAGLYSVKRSNAATRHAVWLLTLFLVVTIFCVHLGKVFSGRPVPVLEPELVTGNFAEGPPAVTALLAGHEVTSSKERAAAAVEEAGAVPGLVAASPPLVVANAAKQAGPNQPAPLLDLFLSAFSLSDPYIRRGLFAYPQEPELRLRERIWQWLTNPLAWPVDRQVLPRFFSLVLISGWLLFAVIRIVVLGARLRRIQGWKSLGTAASPELQTLFDRLRRRSGTRRKVQVRISAAHSSAMLLGFFRPVILLPRLANEAEAEAVLCHELAHVSRRDDWANLLQQLLVAIFLAHPVVWWISRRLLLEREIACDDYVLEQGERPRSYALLLANLAARMQRPVSLLAPGASTHKSQLQERINMILNTHRNISSRLAARKLAWMTVSVVGLSVAVVCAAPRLVLAENEAPGEIAPVEAAGEAVVSAEFAQVAPGRAALDPPAGSPALPRIAPVPALPASPPVPVGAPPAMGPDASLEERLARVEKMLESLLAQPGKRAYVAPRIEPYGQWELKERPFIDPKQAEQIKELAQREAARAGEEVKRRSREAERAARGLNERRLAEGKVSKEAIEKQLEALRRQSERLADERKKLDAEIERLQQAVDSREEKPEESDIKPAPPEKDC